MSSCGFIAHVVTDLSDLIFEQNTFYRTPLMTVLCNNLFKCPIQRYLQKIMNSGMGIHLCNLHKVLVKILDCNMWAFEVGLMCLKLLTFRVFMLPIGNFKIITVQIKNECFWTGVKVLDHECLNISSTLKDLKLSSMLKMEINVKTKFFINTKVGR